MVSSLVVFLNWGVRITPFEVLSVLCGATLMGFPASYVALWRLVEWDPRSTSKRSPDLRRLMDFGSPAKPFMPYCMAKGESLWRDFSSSSGIIIRNLGNSTWPFCNSCHTWLYWALDSVSISDFSVFFFFRCSRWSGANCHYPWWIGWIFYRSGSSPSSEPYQVTIFSGKPAGSIARATWAMYWKQKNSWAISIIAVHTPPPD